MQGYARRAIKGLPGTKHLYRAVLSGRRRQEMLTAIRQEQVVDAWELRPSRSRNPLTIQARRYWSQADEDGILEEILLRTGPTDGGVFIEFGVGNGAECNTLALLARGWKGAWIGGEDLSFTPRPGGRLHFQKAWVTRANLEALTQSARRTLGDSIIDVVSLDFDGNDYHFTSLLLQNGLRPRVWISEYNARLPVGVNWVMEYNDTHRWAGDDYFGASISAFAELFQGYGYFPVACSAQGANIFFVQNDFLENFLDVPKTLEVIYQPPLYALSPSSTHSPSPRTLSSLT